MTGRTTSDDPVAAEESLDPLALERRAEALIRQDRLDEAEAIYRRLLQAQPDHPRALANLAAIRGRQGDSVEMVTLLRRALALRFEDADAHANLGAGLQEQGRLAEAIAAQRVALELQPRHAAAHNNIATAYQRRGNLSAAIHHYRQALAIEPAAPHTWRNLGSALSENGELSEAIASYRRALTLSPDDAPIEAELALAELLVGDYASGWSHYGSRFRCGDRQPLLNALPSGCLWRGEPLKAGASLLLVSEQGLGDTLQFMRYAALLRQRGLTVRLCAQTSLHGLIRTSGIDTAPLTPEQAHGLSDGPWIPLLSLPERLGVRPGQPIISAPYIRTQPGLIKAWAERLAAERRPIVAINWQGNPLQETAHSRGRSLPLESFAPLAAWGEGSLLSLQKGFGSEQLNRCGFRDRFVSCQERVDASWDFEETAAILANCDLVISSDTAVAHLAAGMGRPTWLLLKHVPDWRWGLQGETSFWYPSMRLFRQSVRGDWDGVLERVADALRQQGPAGLAAEPKVRGRQRSGMAKPGSGRTGLPSGRSGRSSSRGVTASTGDRSGLEAQAFAAFQQGQLGEAETIYRQLIEAGSSNASVYSNLAAICGMSSRPGEVPPLLEEALRLDPSHADSHNNLGITRLDLGDLEGARQSFGEALRLRPDFADAHSNLGIVLHQQGLHQEAILSFQRALSLQPALADAHNNLGIALQEQGELDAAIEAYGRAIALKPTLADAYSNLGNTRKERGELAEAIAAYRTALRLAADLPEAHWGLAVSLLLEGDYQQGWHHYAWRSRRRTDPLLPHAEPQAPRWNGEPLKAGSTLLLVSEQGLGDTLQFMRYAIALRRQGLTVSLCAPRRLHSLIRASGLDAAPLSPEQASAVREGQWVPLLSVPGHLGVHPGRPLVRDPYIRASAERIRHWADLLAGERRPIIAINWQGNPDTEKHELKGRSLPLEALAPLARQSGVSLLAIQKGFGSEQLPGCSFRDRFVACQPQVDEALDFHETAAILANCDLVISSDTAVAHLAGGMGLPTWLLLTAIPEWRWGLEGDRSFWYPSMRLFRQRRADDWGELIERVVAALQATSAAELGSGGAAEREPKRAGEPGEACTVIDRGRVAAAMPVAELIDRITRLEIDRDATEPAIRTQARAELEALQTLLTELTGAADAEAIGRLRELNRDLHAIRSALADHEVRRDFGEVFLRLARSLLQQEERREAIKAGIADRSGDRP